MSSIRVYSEIGKLKKVILHRPGREIENIVPEYLETLLFDDIPYLKIAQQEHDTFAEILRKSGTEVYYIEKLMSEVFNDHEVKRMFVEEFLLESDIYSTNLRKALTEYLLALSNTDTVATLIAGIRKKEIKYTSSSLSDIIKSDYEFYLDPMPNLYFTRDPSACIGNGLAINTMKRRARRRESLFVKYINTYHELLGKSKSRLWYDRMLEAPIEGGDILVLSDKVLAIGCSERTSADAIEYLTNELYEGGSGFEQVLVFQIQKRRAFMHLDTVFTMLDYDKFAIHPGIEKDLNIYRVTKAPNNGMNFTFCDEKLENILDKSLNIDGVKLIRCGGGDTLTSSREQWNDGSNTLAVAPGVVVTYDRNYVSNEHLESHGVKVLAMPSSELSRGRGGPRCMSMPVYRE